MVKELGSIPGRIKIFFSSPQHPDQLWDSMGAGGSFPRHKAVEAWIDHSPPSSAEVKNGGAIPLFLRTPSKFNQDTSHKCQHDNTDQHSISRMVTSTTVSRTSTVLDLAWRRNKMDRFTRRSFNRPSSTMRIQHQTMQAHEENPSTCISHDSQARYSYNPSSHSNNAGMTSSPVIRSARGRRVPALQARLLQFVLATLTQSSPTGDRKLRMFGYTPDSKQVMAWHSTTQHEPVEVAWASTPCAS
jgi:hypothetical protein